MIEITHQQARYLIRQGSDGRRLPDEQWAVLQSHLEACTSCRAYRQRLGSVEHDLRRDLHVRWNPVNGPAETQTASVLHMRERQKQRQKISLIAGVAALGMIVLLGVIAYWRANAPAAAPTPLPQVQALPEPTPTAQQITFRGVIAYEDRREGDAEIYLLNLAGGSERKEQVNLTSHPANDYSPAWSPDGEWLAFISDRSGKPEVYVMHLAGSRLTQLTDDPGMIWEGPLSWSRDGRWLALKGSPGVDAWWVYLVPLDGSGPRSLGLTRGASGGVKFSPTLPILAYGMSEPVIGGMRAYRMDNASFFALTREDNYSRGMRTGYQDSFEWSPDGYRLVYLAEGRYDLITGQPDGSQRVQLITTNDLPAFSSIFDSRSNLLLESQSGRGSIRGPTWVPLEAGRVIAYLLDEDGTGCWTVHLRSSRDSAIQPYVLRGLCVEGGLSHSNWLPETQWMVVLARQPGEETPGYYTLRIPRNLSAQVAPEFERLMDMPFETGLDAPGPPDPQVRPKGRALNISPKPVSEFEPLLPPSMPTIEVPGRIIYSVSDFRNLRTFVSLQPGSLGRAMEHSEGRTCPAISPDGDRVAFLSPENSLRAALNEIFVMGMNGQDLRQLTTPVMAFSGGDASSSAQLLPRYSCPVWSPDGLWLASVVETARGSYMVLVAADGSSPMQYILTPPASMRTGLAWAPDSSSLILPSYTRDGREGQILRVYHDQGQLDELRFDIIVGPSNWNDVNGIAFSPDGRWMAYLIVTYEGPSLSAKFELMILEVESGQIRADGWQFNSDARLFYGMSPLTWLPNNQIGLVASYHIDALVKSEVFLYDPGENQVYSLAKLNDLVFDSAFSPDGSWAVLATESGLWALDIDAIIEGRASPARLDTRRVYQVDWR